MQSTESTEGDTTMLTVTVRAAHLTARLTEIVSPEFREEFTRMTKRVWANSGEFKSRKRRFFAFQGGICVKCGQEMMREWDEEGADIMADTFPEMAHIIQAKAFSAHRAGYVFGNIALWCRKCNRENGDKSISVYEMARPELVPLSISELPAKARL